MSWATIEQTINITGVTVTEPKVTQAQFTIELFSGVTEEYAIPRRDGRHLMMAVAYQAAWLSGQVDVTTRSDVSQFTQDNMSATNANQEANVLAPLARQCIKRLSWKKSRSVKLRRLSDVANPNSADTVFLTDDESAESEAMYRPGWGA
jgi:hypothetical protein